MVITHLHEENYSGTLLKWEYADWRQIRKVTYFLERHSQRWCKSTSRTVYKDSTWDPGTVSTPCCSHFETLCHMASNAKYMARLKFPLSITRQSIDRLQFTWYPPRNWLYSRGKKPLKKKNKLNTGQADSKQWWNYPIYTHTVFSPLSCRFPSAKICLE